MARDHVEFEEAAAKYFNSLSELDFDLVPCIFCKQSLNKSFVLFRKGSMIVERCECGFVFNSRQPNQSALNRFYDDSNAINIWSNLKQSQTEKFRQYEKFGEAVNLVVNTGAKSILDIGCGNGEFLRLIKEANPDVKCLGIDTHERALEVARSSGILAEHYTVEEFVDQTDKTFDVVSLWGVLEHVKNPLRVLYDVDQLVAPDGHLIICVPNVFSEIVCRLWDKCYTFCPQHLWYFDRETIGKVVPYGYFMSDYYTIEPESIPILRHNMGFDPYKKMPGNFERMVVSPRQLKFMNDNVLQEGKGYKMVCVFKKISDDTKIVRLNASARGR